MPRKVYEDRLTGPCHTLQRWALADSLRFQIVVAGAEQIPEAMAQASQAIATTTAEAGGHFEKFKQHSENVGHAVNYSMSSECEIHGQGRGGGVTLAVQGQKPAPEVVETMIYDPRIDHGHKCDSRSELA